jgi:hypothetical protein
MAKCMNCGGSKKMGYMDLGGNTVNYNNPYQGMEPTSGYGTSQSSAEGPWRPKTGLGRFFKDLFTPDQKGYDYGAHKKRNKEAFNNRNKCGRNGC